MKVESFDYRAKSWLPVPPEVRWYTSRRSLKRLLRGQKPKPMPVSISPVAPPFETPLIVAGLFRSVTGIGQSARLCVRTLQELGCPVSYCDLSSSFNQGHFQIGFDAPKARPGDPGSILLHLNPPEVPRALAMMGRRLVSDRRVIGYWHWELPRAPVSWMPVLEKVHEIWVPTRFVADAFRPDTNLPIKIVPHIVPMPSPSSRTRAEFGISDEAFVVVAAFNLDSSIGRKNPLASIAAFRQAFGADPKFQMVLKVSSVKRHAEASDALDRAIDGVANIQILHETLSRPDMSALLNCCDVVISLHRSEGFALVPAEAMLLGKPVIATGWSGNVDFMTDENSALVKYRLVPVRDQFSRIYSESENPNQNWADPNIDDAAHWLRRFADDPDLRGRIGARAALDARQIFSVSNYARSAGLGARTEGCAA